MPSRSSAGQFISAVALSGAIALVCTGQREVVRTIASQREDAFTFG